MNQFVTNERVSEFQNNTGTVFRFFWNLKLLRIFFIWPTLLSTILYSLLPQYTLWYLGKLVNFLQNPGDASIVHEIFSYQFIVPLSINFLWILFVVMLIARLGSSVNFGLSSQWSTLYIHADMMQSITKVRTTFFDENPSGRLLNRLLGDFHTVRIDGVWTLKTFLSCLLVEVPCVAVLVCIIAPLPSLLIIPLVFLYAAIQLQIAPMMSRARELKSIEDGKTLHRETDIIEGSHIFLFYNKIGSVLERLYQVVKRSTNIGIFYARLMAWSFMAMELTTVCYRIVVYIILIIALANQMIDSVLCAVIITALYMLTSKFYELTVGINGVVRNTGLIRRIFQIIDLPPETAEESRLHNNTTVPRHRLPVKGDIVFEDFSMSYRQDSPNIIEGLNLTIPEGKKTGIIGNTGTGKTSLLQSIFRMVYHQGGDIKIGGISIYGYETNHLRGYFGIVPQEPYLFAGDIRFNLTGNDEHSHDERLREILAKIGLRVELDAPVAEGGKDYSIGERQLLSLARAIFANKPYIFMDEPTSSIDMQTDAKIQRIIHTYLADRTVITIAHRLESLENYDFVIELKNGKLHRAGNPRMLFAQFKDNRLLPAGEVNESRLPYHDLYRKEVSGDE